MGDRRAAAGGLAIRPRVKVYFDGGCRPAGMEIAVVIQGRVHLQRDLGPGSSLTAEWLALIRAVEITRELGLSNAVFLGDALAVILPATGAVKCRGTSCRYFADLRAITASAPLTIRHIKRTQNLAGIALAQHHAGVSGLRPIAPRARLPTACSPRENVAIDPSRRSATDMMATEPGHKKAAKSMT